MSEVASVGNIAESGVLITAELYQRPCRPPNLEAEVQILRALGQQLTRPPQAILKYLVETTVNLCQAGTAGISLIETLPSGEEVFRWVALAGVYESFEGGTTDREHSFCGVCLKQGCPQLYHHPERYFSCLEPADPPIVEELVVPLLLEGQALGTIWIAAHDQQRQFDGEDVRILTSLANFTAAALQSSRLRHAAEEAQNELGQQTIELTHTNQELKNTLEELSVTEEELRTQNDELAVSRQAVDVEWQRYQDLFNFAPDGYLVTDVHGTIQEANQVAIALLDWHEASPVGVPLRLFVSEPDRQTYLRYLTQLREAEAVQSWELNLRSQQGRCFPASLSAIATRNPEGQITGLRWMIRDIAARKQVEAALRQSEARFRAVAANLPNGAAFIVDHDLRYRLAAGKAIESAGMTPEDLVGKTLWEALDPTLADRYEPYFRQALAGKPFSWEHNSHDRHYVSHGTPLYNDQGGVDAVLAVSYDITERKQVEASLQESEELKQRILESSNDCIKVLALDGRLLYMNAGGVILLEVDDPVSLQKAKWVDFWQDEDQENAKAAIAAAKAGNVGRFQGYCPTAKGTPKWWDVAVTPIRDASGQIAQLLVISRDITEIKRMETERQQADLALREAHVQLESALVAGAVYTWRWNIKSDRVIVNTAFADLFAVDPVSASTQGLPISFFIDAMHEEDRPHVSTAIQRAIKTGEKYATEYRVRTATGEERWLTAQGQVEYDAAGNPVSFPGALIDITDRKQAEEFLRQSEERYRTLFESIDDGFCIIEVLFDETGQSIDYRFLEINPAFEKQTGLINAQGKRMREIAPDNEAYWFEIYGRVALSGEPIRSEHYAQALHRWYEVYACRIGQPENRKVAVLFKDISPAKRIEAERERLLQQEQAARAVAEQANRIKDEFLAVLSHELRSPLNPILGWSSLLRKGRLNAQKTAYALETIERNAQLQVKLIEDLLDVSRILQGKLNLNRVPINLAAIIQSALETVRLAAEAKSIQIQTELDAEVGQVLGDSARLQQIIWNLLTNAVKFTPEGGRVEIRLQRMGTQAQIRVRDTGKGIEPDFLPYVFEYFRQADNATTRKFGGLGLGLAIVHHLVELHGGTVQVESPGEGQGATFTVRLPLTKAQPIPDEIIDDSTVRHAKLPLAGIKILVVDDDQDSRDFCQFVLEQSGALVTAAGSAHEALQTLALTKPDILLSDVGMPEMDGYMLLRQIKAWETERGETETPIRAIALTAYAGELNQQQALAAGFQHHLSKPIAPETLIDTVINLTT